MPIIVDWWIGITHIERAYILSIIRLGKDNMDIIDGDPTHSPEDFLYLAELRQRYEDMMNNK
jgi:hypothetical protein